MDRANSAELGAPPARVRGMRMLFGSLVAVALIALTIQMALGPGITADEIVQRVYGDLILAFFRSHGTDARALSYHNLYLYGGLFELPAQWLLSTGVLPWPTYDARHVLTALLSLFGVIATGLTAQRIRGTRAALIAAAMLLLTPAWVGHSLFNPKDIPFGVAAAFVMYTSVRIAMRAAPLSWRDAIYASLALGCALGVRPGGLFVIAFPVAAACLRFALTLKRDGWDKQSLRASVISIARLACAFPLAWLLMLSTWPWALQAPLTRPFQVAAVAADFDLSGKTRFDGRTASFGHLPADYLLTWFRVTLPDIYLLACVCGVISLVGLVVHVARDRQRLDPGRTAATLLLCAFVAVPVLGVFIVRPTLYDGHRHFIFLIPGIAALAALAIDQVLDLPAAVRGSVAALGLLLASVTLYDMWSLHPYEYVYFNRASGGLAGQATRFETDYWGASYREGFEWVVKHYDPGGRRKITVRTCAADRHLSYYVKLWNVKRFVLTKQGTSELYLSTTKRDCHERPGEVIHKVERQGVPLLYVLRRTPLR